MPNRRPFSRPLPPTRAAGRVAVIYTVNQQQHKAHHYVLAPYTDAGAAENAAGFFATALSQVGLAGTGSQWIANAWEYQTAQGDTIFAGKFTSPQVGQRPNASGQISSYSQTISGVFNGSRSSAQYRTTKGKIEVFTGVIVPQEIGAIRLEGTTGSPYRAFLDGLQALNNICDRYGQVAIFKDYVTLQVNAQNQKRHGL